MSKVVIAGGARTPIGKFQGAFAGLTAMDLGGTAIRGALERSKAKASDVDYVVFGQVVTGMDVVRKLTRTMDSGNRPVPGVEPDKIVRARMLP